MYRIWFKNYTKKRKWNIGLFDNDDVFAINNFWQNVKWHCKSKCLIFSFGISYTYKIISFIGIIVNSFFKLLSLLFLLFFNTIIYIYDLHCHDYYCYISKGCYLLDDYHFYFLYFLLLKKYQYYIIFFCKFIISISINFFGMIDFWNVLSFLISHNNIYIFFIFNHIIIIYFIDFYDSIFYVFNYFVFLIEI